MTEKINIAEILKDCPKGMELYSPLCGKCVFDRLNFGTIICKKQNTQEITFTSKGYYMLPVFDDCECMIFPSKDQRDWSKFEPPYEFKDGDIVVTKTSNNFIFYSIYKGVENREVLTYVDYCLDGNRLIFNDNLCSLCLVDEIVEQKLATEEEKKKLFQAIKNNGYNWNAETKTLEKLTVPSTPEKFYIRIGDIPSEERSSVYNGDVVVGYEDGVSVYNCVETDGLYRIVMPFPLKEGQGMTYECLIQEITQCRYEIENPRNVYLVSGIEVGKGSDNEPVIKNVKILKDLTEQFNTKNDNTEETKTLEKLPKFKVGDKIVKKGDISVTILISEVDDECYYSTTEGSIGLLPIAEQDDWELVSNKFDINTLKPFDKVLMRSSNAREWMATFYSHYSNNKFYGCGMCCDQCIPYEKNEHLLGTTNDCSDYYKNW